MLHLSQNLAASQFTVNQRMRMAMKMKKLTALDWHLMQRPKTL